MKIKKSHYVFVDADMVHKRPDDKDDRESKKRKVKEYEENVKRAHLEAGEDHGFYGHVLPSDFKRTNQIKTTGKGAI